MSIIERLECPKCHRHEFSAAQTMHWARGAICPGTPVQRRYVAVDTLLDAGVLAGAAVIDEGSAEWWEGTSEEKADMIVQAACEALTRGSE